MERVFEDYRDYACTEGAVVALGNFDGLHAGHQMIIKTCLQEAKQHSLRSVLFTFKPHPMKVILGEQNAPRLLLPYFEKITLLKQTGIDVIIEQNFTNSFARLSADDFIQEVLVNILKAKTVVVGENFHFGYKAEGHVECLKKKSQFSVHDIPCFSFKNQVVSSSLIRKCVMAGDVEQAQNYLQYPFFLTGTIGRGRGQGRTLRFPTANLLVQNECWPAHGVYASILEDTETSHYFCGVTNIGTNPTFGNLNPRIETYLFHFEGDLYDRNTRLFLFRRLRDEKKWKNVKELTLAINNDVQHGSHYFESLSLFQNASSTPIHSLNNPPILAQHFEPFKIISNLSCF